jgi:hypothetical protein
MATVHKFNEPDFFIRKKEELDVFIKETKKRNFSRRVNHIFGLCETMKKELMAEGLWEETEKNPQ